MQFDPTTKLSPRITDLAGKRFGQLTVLSFSHINNERRAVWNCICDCGNECRIIGTNMTKGDSRSCGCLAIELRSINNSTHGMTKHPLARTYRAMIDRCYNPAADSYPRYGGRGIVVCGRWRESIANFVADMGDKPEGTTLHRIDNNGPYCPENCRWVNTEEQQNNKTNSHYLTYDGQTMTIAQWSRATGIKYEIIQKRIYAGWSTERALSEPVHNTRGEYDNP